MIYRHETIAPYLSDMETLKLDRRELLTASGLTLLAAQSGFTAVPEMQYRALGKTGQSVSCLGMGGSHIGKTQVSRSEATKLIRQARPRHELHG